MSADPDFWNDQERAQRLQKQRGRLEAALKEIEGLSTHLEDAGVLLELADEAGGEEVETEVSDLLTAAESELSRMELRRMMSGPHDQANCILEIHAGAGGVDAQDWAEMLYRMYTRWCERAGFDIEEADYQPGDEAGIKTAVLMVRGDYAYGWLRAEEGVHRLVRISPFDANARRQTSFAAVRVTPELEDDVAVDIDWEKDVREDRLRSSGAGGQHVNKTESAIRLTHLETGIVVACQSERSQHKNRATARKILSSRLYDYYQAQQDEERSKIGGEKLKIEWGSQIRSYVNHPYRMVKDLRTEHESTQFDAVLDGALDDFMEAFLLSTQSPAPA
jgi:peptide chain release factor 2